MNFFENQELVVRRGLQLGSQQPTPVSKGRAKKPVISRNHTGAHVNPLTQSTCLSHCIFSRTALKSAWHLVRSASLIWEHRSTIVPHWPRLMWFTTVPERWCYLHRELELATMELNSACRILAGGGHLSSHLITCRWAEHSEV